MTKKAVVRKEPKKSKSSNKMLFYSIFLIVIVFVVIIGIINLNNRNTETGNPYLYKYGTFTFKKLGNFWYTDMILGTNQDTVFNLEMRYDPKSLEDIYVDPSVKDTFFSSKGFYLTAHPNLTGKTAIAMLEVERIIGQKHNMLNFPLLGAVTHFVEDPDGLIVVVDCKNATKMHKIIWFGIGNESKIEVDNYCMKIYGTNQSEIIRVADRFLYEILSVMHSSG